MNKDEIREFLYWLILKDYLEKKDIIYFYKTYGNEYKQERREKKLKDLGL